MAIFENKTIQFLQNIHFHTEVMKFFLGLISIFDIKVPGMKTNVDEYTSILRYYFSTYVTFKTLITQHQDQLPLRHIKK